MDEPEDIPVELSEPITAKEVETLISPLVTPKPEKEADSPGTSIQTNSVDKSVEEQEGASEMDVSTEKPVSPLNSDIVQASVISLVPETVQTEELLGVIIDPEAPTELAETKKEELIKGEVEVEDIPATGEEISTCYCQKERNLNVVELQCAICSKWFHQDCINIPLGNCIPFITNYAFTCKICNPARVESFTKRPSNFSQVCLTAIANLMQQSIARGEPKIFFSRDKEIVPYIDKNWENLTTMQRRVKQTWHNTIQKTMLKEVDIFVCQEQPSVGEEEGEQLFGLMIQDLKKIVPGFEGQLKQGISRFNDPQAIASGYGGGGGGFGKGRGAKRKLPVEGQTSSYSKKPKSDLTMPKLPPHGYPLEHPFNKDGYRYILAEPDPHAPFRQEFDESSDWAGKPIPGWLYRTLVPNSVFLAMHDRAPQLRVAEDRISVVGEKGYCMIRATHGVCRGTWYFECTVEDMPENSATRIGWSQPLANLQAPLGYDKFGYSWRSRKGTKFHQSRGLHYCETGYGQGDVLGLLIHLPYDSDQSIPLPQTFKDKPLVKFKSYLYFEEKDEVQTATKSLKTLNGSKISFYKNGERMGVAYEDIFGGTYYPAISLYKNCTISLNFGPTFKYPPNDVPFKGMDQAGHEALIEQTASDLIYFAENEGKLRLDTFVL